MIAELARFSLGRVLLHLISMLGDRAFRFHAAGIMRELSWATEPTALLARVCTSWQQAARARKEGGWHNGWLAYKAAADEHEKEF